MTGAAESDSYGGVWDDIQTALKWKPILPLLQNLETSGGLVGKAEAIKEVAAFAVRVGLKEDPYRHRVFLIYCKFIELLRRDEQWRRIVEDILK